MRILAIDYGDAHTGAAVSDLTGLLAGYTEVIHSRKEEAVLQRLGELIAEYEVEELVLGYPKNMNDSLGERAEKTLAFQEMLERRTGLTVQLWDERLTTVAADKAMIEAGIRRENRKEHVDKIAAVFILQGYLDFCRNKQSE